MNHKHKFCLFLLFSIILLYGWGASGHKVINRRSTFSFPSTMSFLNWADSLAAHASDADIRKSTDPNESPRHFIDIDDYPEFIATGRIPENLDSLIAIHGSSFVYDKGILPFSIIATIDSVKKYFELHNYSKAMLHAADLGHYVGDGHMPLHITRNYNGQYTNQTGVHSRYETQLINRDSGNIIYSFENAVYIPDVKRFTFDFLYSNYRYVDSVLKCDSIANAMAPGYGTTYYQIYWQLAGNFTGILFNNASHFLASLIYTAWVNAGGVTSLTLAETSLPENLYLGQNYPNPFNPATKIKFEIPDAINSGRDGSITNTRLTIYDISGKEIASLLNEQLQPGLYEVEWNAGNYPSGTYIYNLTSGAFSDTRKMFLIK
ncbi:MAG TPA: T9SS type A sorting domain-containing protein [Ignavibacteria bacterium]|nr:T9SS type A sorting domain-containing protein [Ignavibacteria bacterium]HMR40970.1 T9SS type A sorting domain-containing protein [Ignavibacteria bacterium]